jgi:trimeric autotransporter adhesin
MQKSIGLTAAFSVAMLFSFAQSVGVGTSTPHTSAQIDISSTNKGLLIPRMSTANINAIVQPAKGLMVLDTVTNQLLVNMGTGAAPSWQTVVAKSGWALTGNTGTDPANQYLGTTDMTPLRFRTNNFQSGEVNPDNGNVFLGYRTGSVSPTTATTNSVAIGKRALGQGRYQDGIVAIGDSALFANGDFPNSSGGQGNTGVGSKSLQNNSSGRWNTALGFETLKSSGFRDGSTAVGYRALRSMVNGSYNTAVGINALSDASSGTFNTALGSETLMSNIDGFNNTAVGSYALLQSISGHDNVAIGQSAQFWSENGHYNTSVGTSSLSRTTNSQYNVCVGYGAGRGFDMGYNNTILGANCDVNQAGLFNVIAIGQAVTITASSQARIGNPATNSIGGYVGWSNLSDARFKLNVAENVPGLDFIMKLKPTTYHLDITALSKELDEGRGKELDVFSKQAIAQKEKMLFSGFVAQEVEKAAKEIGYDFSGIDKPQNEKDFYGLRYAEFVVPLVKAMQEQQAMIEELKKSNEELKRQLSELLKLASKKERCTVH